jgi:hypothetical protein
MERILEGEEDTYMCMCEDSIMKPTKYCFFKGGGGKGVQEI